MFERLIEWVKSLFGKPVGRVTRSENARSEQDRKKYEETEVISFTAIFSGFLANKTMSDSDIIITDSNDGTSRRSELVKAAMEPLWRDMKQITDDALGKGGMFLVPYVVGERVFVAAIDQADCVVTGVNGAKEITSISIRADQAVIDHKMYQRIVDYTLENGVLTIRNAAVGNDGKIVPMDTVPEWAGITEEITMAGVERMPVGYLKSPKNNRKTGSFYGVPITYGAGETMEDLHECIDQIRREFRLKQTFVGAEESLFGKGNKLPGDGIFKIFKAAGALTGSGESFWEVFDPAFRDSSYYNRYSHLCEQLEKEVGTSKGVLTKPENAASTAYEVKSQNKDTFDLVSDIRAGIEEALGDVAYGIDCLAEYFGLTPAGSAGDYKITYDWDCSLIESTTETFSQYSELQSRGLITGARLVAYATGMSMEESQAEVDAAAEEAAKGAPQITAEELEP